MNIGQLRSSLVALTTTLILVACGSEQGQAPSMDSGTSETPRIGGSYRIDAAPPFEADVAQASLRCQAATPGSPFRAEWQDPVSKTAVLVTGYPLDDGSNATRVDNFQVTSFGQNQVQKNADLAGAELSVTQIQKAGASSFYEVRATGRFTNEGTFTASGTCRA